MFQGGFLAGLRRVDGAGGDFFAVVFLFLLHFFVVRDIAWVGHECILDAGRMLDVGQGACCGSA